VSKLDEKAKLAWNMYVKRYNVRAEWSMDSKGIDLNARTIRMNMGGGDRENMIGRPKRSIR